MDEIMFACMQQKELMFTQMLNLSKRVEMRCRQEEVDVSDFLEQRKVCFERIQKCDALAKKRLQELESEEEHTRQWAIFTGSAELAACKDEKEKVVLTSAQSCKDMRLDILRLDHAANKMLRVKCDDMREKINELRQKQMQSAPQESKQEIFH